MTTMGAEKPDITEVAVILGVDTHLDFHVAVALDHLGAGVWVSSRGRRRRRATATSPLGRKGSTP